MTAEKLFLICKGEKPAGFSPLLFHGRGRNGRQHLLVLAPCGSIAPARKRTLSGASRQLSRRESQGRGGSASCLSLWERWLRPSGADGEGAPAPCGELPPQRLRGLQIGEAKKMRLAKRLAFFRFDFSFGIIKGEQPLIRGSSASKSPCPCRAEHAAFASQTGLRLKSPTGAFMPSGHRRLFWFSFGRQKRTLSSAKHFRKRPLSLPAEQISPRPSVIINKPVIVFFAFE